MRNLVFLSIVFLALAACQQNASSRVVVSSNLDTYSNAKLKWGEPIVIEMETANHDSIQLQLNGKKVQGSNVTLSKENSVLGKNTLKLLLSLMDEIICTMELSNDIKKSNNMININQKTIFRLKLLKHLLY